jgi:hypothetical protein
MPAVGSLSEKFVELPLKRPGLTPHLLAATLFLASGLLAEEAKPNASAPIPKTATDSPMMKPTLAEEILKRFDKNGDGKLDEDEQAEAHEVMLKEQMGREAAKTAGPDGGQQYRAKMLEMFDKNHDGRLDDDERAEARKYAAEHGFADGAAELVKRFDKDGDGKLNVEETTALLTFLRQVGGGNTAAVSPTAAAEAERLSRVAAEVARRRAEREKAAKAIGAK